LRSAKKGKLDLPSTRGRIVRYVRDVFVDSTLKEDVNAEDCESKNRGGGLVTGGQDVRRQTRSGRTHHSKLSGTQVVS
jgi:hypothetical protein